MRAAAASARHKDEEPVLRMLWERTLGLGELAVGELRAADAHFAAALEALADTGFREPAVWHIHGDAIEAALAVGDLARAEQLLVSLEESAARTGIPWTVAVSARCRGLVHAAAGELEQAAEALERARREHERCPVPFELARTLLAQGKVHRRANRRSAPAKRSTRRSRSSKRSVPSPGPSARARSVTAPRSCGTRRAQSDRAPDRAACRRRAHERRDRGGGLRDAEDRGGEPRPRLSQAGDPVAGPARARSRLGGAAEDSVGFSRFRRGLDARSVGSMVDEREAA